MLNRALRYASLRPYGDSLLTPAGAFWIFAVRLAVVLMASAEAFGWSYAAFYMALGDLRWAAGAAAFAFTFITVCLIDASLMTLDRWSLTNDHRLTGEAPPDGTTRMRDLLSVSTRIALVALSMYITAPFLAQLMFKSDIERSLHDERVEIRASARQSMLAPIDARLASLDAHLDQRRAALDAEVAGGGRSGRYGDGPAARQLRATVASLEKERAGLTTEHARVAAEFDTMSDQAVAERYKLALPGDSFQERSRALAKSRNETYRVTERAVQAFLAFLFAALLLLKLFEPRSVSIYFSERLQALYRQYLGGLFDAQIEPAERSAGSAPMTPLRFEDWCLSNYPSLRAREAEAISGSDQGERARAVFCGLGVGAWRNYSVRGGRGVGPDRAARGRRNEAAAGRGRPCRRQANARLNRCATGRTEDLPRDARDRPQATRLTGIAQRNLDDDRWTGRGDDHRLVGERGSAHAVRHVDADACRSRTAARRSHGAH
jgi:hypothetical protein